MWIKGAKNEIHKKDFKKRKKKRKEKDKAKKPKKQKQNENEKKPNDFYRQKLKV